MRPMVSTKLASRSTSLLADGVLWRGTGVPEEREPGGLLGVVELGAAASLLAQAASMARKACSMELETWPLPEDSTPGDDEPAADQICLLRFASGFVPVQSFPQAAIAR